MDDDTGWWVLLVCENGHVIADSPDGDSTCTEDQCRRCGAKTIQHCPKCNHIIRSRWHSPVGFSERLPRVPPNGCNDCRAAYPWTLKAIEEVRRIGEAADLSRIQRAKLIGFANGIMVETPNTERCAIEFKNLADRAGKQARRELLKWASGHGLKWVVVRFFRGRAR